MNVYISGPMTGLPDYNYPEFRKAAALLSAMGHVPLDPSSHFGGDTSQPRESYMRADIADLLEADAVLVLDGWRKSKGATLEVAIARELGLRLVEFTAEGRNLRDVPAESALEEAQRLVHGDRGAAYGHPADDFARTGRMWGAILGIPDVPAEKVGLCMAAVKISREVNKPGRDNRVDLAGYAETVEMIHDRQP